MAPHTSQPSRMTGNDFSIIYIHVYVYVICVYILCCHGNGRFYIFGHIYTLSKFNIACNI